MDPERALPELARVLRPGGVLAALWNGDDLAVDWVAGYLEAAGIEPPAPDQRPSFPPYPAFGPTVARSFRHQVPRTVDGLVANLATRSWALISDPVDRDRALTAAREHLRSRPGMAAGTFDEPQVTDVLRAVRRP